jgi:hypothetical protein
MMGSSAIRWLRGVEINMQLQQERRAEGQSQDAPSLSVSIPITFFSALFYPTINGDAIRN